MSSYIYNNNQKKYFKLINFIDSKIKKQSIPNIVLGINFNVLKLKTKQKQQVVRFFFLSFFKRELKF